MEFERGAVRGFEIGSAQVSDACGGALAASNLETEVKMLLRILDEVLWERAPSVHVRAGVE